MRTAPTRRSKTRVTVTPERKLHFAKAAHLELQIALDHAKKADCPLLAGRIRDALKSAGGAVRHAKAGQGGVDEGRDGGWIVNTAAIQRLRP